MKVTLLACLISFSLAAFATDGPDRSKPTPKPPKGPPPVTTNSGSRNLDTCFSPAGNCDQKLVALVESARHTLDMAIYSITLPDLEKAIESAKSHNVQIRLVVDRVQAKGASSLVGALEKAGIPIKIGNVKGIMHDKYTIVDGSMIETGSFNYSANATDDNAENQIYMSDPTVIENYTANFNALWSAGLPTSTK
jgi:phosphatidylserine/phosphatidylglycerophosphate/cardiolipin synthase-like enzyme